MEDKNMNCTNEAVKKIIDNMTAEVPNSDGQYVPLVFPSPPANVENINWPQQPNYINHMRPGIEQYQKQQFGFMPQPNARIFDYQNNFEEPDTFNGILEPGLYENKDSFSPIYDRDYRLLLPPQQELPQPETVPQVQNSTLIEHLVGNWMAPNTTGTYSPFGTTAYYKPKVFETERDLNLNQLKDDKFKPAEEDIHFHFNRDSRKPRIVAEVKPMRPSYSDVLAKSVPQTSSTKIHKSDSKESKPKKENKSGKDKEKKINTTLNRTNTNIEIKDATIEKNPNSKMEYSKTNNLSRKWASMDNIANSNGQKAEESKKKKPEEKPIKISKQEAPKKLNKTINVADLENETSKYENVNVTKNGIKKINKPCIRPKSNDSLGSNERPPGKRNQRTRKKENHVPFGVFRQKLKQYMKGWWKILTVFVFWLIHLISDICSLSLHIIRDMFLNCWSWMRLHWTPFMSSIHSFLRKFRIFSWIRDKYKKKKDLESEDGPNFVQNGLQNNINMPTTGEEAMKRLLACKGKDPYSILGVTPTCTDDDIKRYYKRQAFLVHPDKNNQPGAEEAFKILVHAFGMIGEPDRRAAYDRGVVESAQVVQAWTELTELLQQLQQKVEAAANTIRCSACGLRHKRVKIDRPTYAARNCNTCKIHHAAREGDIWAEAKVLGFLWHYFACMEGGVYDITEWAGCQKDSLKHLRPDSHHVQYRIALGKQNGQQKRHSQCAHSDKPDLENLINSLYGQNENAQGPRNRRKKTNK